jgi:hypothetical protein
MEELKFLFSKGSCVMIRKVSKIVCFNLILILSLLFTGCVEIFHFISIEQGQLKMSLRYTIQKAIFEMGASFSGESVDYDGLLSSGDGIIEPFGGLDGFSTIATHINNPVEIGSEITITGQASLIDWIADDDIPFLPFKAGDRYRILLPSMYGDGGDNEYGVAFLAGAKYRLLIDRAGPFRNIRQVDIYAQGDKSKDMVRFFSEKMGDSAETEEYFIRVKEYGNSLLIEIPILLLFMQPEELVLELY